MKILLKGKVETVSLDRVKPAHFECEPGTGTATQRKMNHVHLLISLTMLNRGGEGCHLRVVPPGQLLRRPSTPKPFIKPGFSIFLT